MDHDCYIYNGSKDVWGRYEETSSQGVAGLVGDE